MTLTLAYQARSEVGLVRSNNQDSAYVSPTMLVVADGMGGAAAGDLASAVAAEEFRSTDQRLPELIANSGRTHVDAEALIHVLDGALTRANERLAGLVLDDPALEGMGTTVCGLVLRDDVAALVNIGDSRAYRLRDGVLTRLTHDHSWVQTLVDSGRLTEAEALEHPHRSLILRVLNGSPEHIPDFHTEELLPGDRLMLCTDGLCGMVTDAELEEPVAIPDRRAAVDALVSLAYSAGGHDNVTIVVADVETDGPPGPVQLLGAAAALENLDESEQTLTLDTSEVIAPEERAITEEERYALQGRRRVGTSIKLALGFLVPILILLAGGFGWYTYTQNQYFVGEHDGHVAIYRGVPDRVPFIELRHLVTTDETRLDNLPGYYAQQVTETIRVKNLDAAESTVQELRDKSKACLAQRAERLRPPGTPILAPEPTPDGLPTPWEPSASPTPDAPLPDEEC